jgi:hypothetical protein
MAAPANGQGLTAVGVGQGDPAAIEDAWETPADLVQMKHAKAITPQGDHFLFDIFGR